MTSPDSPAPSPSVPAPAPRERATPGFARAALGTRLAFWIAGFGIACWAPLVPYARDRLGVDDGGLGLLLLCLGVGSVAAMVRTGPLCARHGCRPVIVIAALGLVALLPALALAAAPWQLAVALLAFGAALGSIDVAMNVHAVEVERDAGRPLMSGFHALFSVGAVTGAGLMSLLLSRGIGPLPATLLCALPMALGIVLLRGRLLYTAGGAAAGAGWAWPRGPVLLLAALAALCFLVEGALLDWSALLMIDSGLASAAHAGWGYAAFSVAMTAARFSGDALSARLGDRAMLAGSGVLGLLGLVALLLSGSLVPALVAFVLVGLGIANIVPVLFRRAGTQRRMPPALAIAAVTTTGYAGLLLGPALVGFVSQAASLGTAFWGLAALLLLVPLTAGRVARPDPPG